MPFPPGLLRSLATQLVNEVTQLNNNWDAIDTGFTSLYGGALTAPAVTSPARGTEWINNTGKLMVYDGSSWIEPAVETWGNWTAVTITAPYMSVPGNGVFIRKSNLNNVEMRGAVQLNATVDPFPNSGYIQVSSGQFNLASGYCPEMTSIFEASMNLTATGFTTGFIYLTVTTTPTTLSIYILPQGTRASGNSISFDNVRYKGA
jgi:hypothetical protein